MRDRLIELLFKANDIVKRNGFNFNAMVMADHLLANGVIVPPCKVGETVYRVIRDKRIKQPYEYKVIGFWYSADETCNNAHLVRYVNGVFDSSISVPFSEFGKAVFLTRKEAEKALAERNEKNER